MGSSKYRFILKSNLFTLSLVIFTGLSLFYSCGGETDMQVVDFSKTVAVDRPISSVPESAQLKVAVAAIISPKETFIYYRQLLDYIGQKMGREIQFVQRKTYGEINELLARGQIDLAFICSGPYVVGKEKYGFQLVATPEVQNSHFYHSYLIINKTSEFRTLEDLRGRVFAFTDPDSNSGKLVPTYWLWQMGETAETFFEKTIYTYSHDNSIMAVARALVDGATVDGHKWEYFQAKNPIYSSRTKVIKKSEPFGSPPLVASVAMPPHDKELIQQVVFNMHRYQGGRTILDKLMIERFVLPDEKWYEPIRQMEIALKPSGDLTHETKKF